MAKELFIFMDTINPDSEQPAQGRWLLCSNGKPVGKLIDGSLATAAKVARDTRVIVIVPGEDVVINEVHLPGQNRQRLLKALPYAMEDQIIDDVEDMHFVLGPRQGDGIYMVAIVKQERMNDWVNACDELGLRPQIMLPDTLALSTAIGTWSILLESRRAVVRTGVQSGFAVDHDNLNLLLSSTISDADGVMPERIDIVDCREVTAKADDFNLGSGIELRVNDFGQDSLLWLAGHFDYEAPINLMSGEYSRKEKVKGQLRKWYPAVAMLTIWLVWQLVASMVSYVSLNNESKQLSGAMTRLYKATFPAVQRIVNAPVQMKQKYDESIRRSGVNSSGLTEMLTSIAPVLRSAQGMHIKSLRYQNGRIDLEFEIKDFSALNQLEKNLANKADMEVEIKSASQVKQKVAGRIQIQRNNS